MSDGRFGARALYTGGSPTADDFDGAAGKMLLHSLSPEVDTVRFDLTR
jgi:hypothetical protein